MERRGRFIKYDKQQVLQDIVDGDLSAKVIAKNHGITRDMVYSLKHAAKKRNIIRETVPVLDDLDPIYERNRKGGPYAHKIYLIAQDYAEGKMGGEKFYQEVKKMLQEN